MQQGREVNLHGEARQVPIPTAVEGGGRGRKTDTGQTDLQPTPLHSFPGSSPGSGLLHDPVCSGLSHLPARPPGSPHILPLTLGLHGTVPFSPLSRPHHPNLHFTPLHLLPKPGAPLTCPLGLPEVSSWSKQTSCLSPSPQSC